MAVNHMTTYRIQYRPGASAYLVHPDHIILAIWTGPDLQLDILPFRCATVHTTHHYGNPPAIQHLWAP